MDSFLMSTDAMGRSTHIIAPSSHIDAVTLSSNGTRQVTVPVEARLVLFSATAPFWARIGGAAVRPLADVADGSAPELNPVARTVTGGSVIGLAVAEACSITLSYYR